MDWSGWTDSTKESEIVWQTGYEAQDDSIPKMDCYRREPKAGINGGGALVFSRTDPAEYRFLPLELPCLKGGRVYRLRMWVRAEDIKGCDPAKSMEFGGMEFFGNEAYHSGSYFWGEPVSVGDFTEHVKEFTVPANTTAFLSLCMQHNATGRLYYDNVTIEGTGEQYTSVLTWPPTLAVRPSTPDFRFQVDPQAPMGLSMLVTVTQGVNFHEQWLELDAAHQAVGHWPATLLPGKATLDVVLADTARRRIVGRDSYPIRILPDDAPLPMDKSGRLIVDGKPFMPIGAYAVPCNDDDLQRTVDTGFNCIMNYDIYDQWDSTSTDVSLIRKRLDLIQSHGLRIIFSLKDLLPCEKDADKLASVPTLVNGVKQHPSLLAWYVSDEVIRVNVPQILALRNTISQLDAIHPTWTATCHAADFPYYGISGDIVGISSYPIDHLGGDNQHISSVAIATQAASTAGLPVWFVPQMFNWGRHKEPKWDKDTWQRSRAPNAEELRAMSLLAAIHGAKGFVFFAYLDWYNAVEALVPGEGAKNLERMKPTTAILHRLAPYLLSDRQTPKTPLAEATENVHAREFMDENGHHAVIVVATGGKAHARLELAPQLQWKSTFGTLRQLRPGCFELDADSVVSDVLFAAP